MSSKPLPARRDFLRQVSGITAATVAASAQSDESAAVTIVTDASDSIGTSAPVRWACLQLQEKLHAKGVNAEIAASAGRASRFVVLVAGDQSALARKFGENPVPQRRESLSLEPGRFEGRPAVLVSSSDIRGYVYGIMEVADRVEFSSHPESALALRQPVKESSANDVRSIARAFCSEIEDKAWYYDREFWRAYLTMLATHRFNRFSLTFGLGYDFPRGVTGDYFHFLYPYLFAVPGYDVRVVPLAESERDRNLETLQFIAAETAARGLHFQLGIWTHAYQWTDSPNSTHHIEGLSSATHAQYCRDALALLLKSCPEINGLTLRVHGESGIPEGSYDFWQTVFEGIARCGRQVEIDMHAKGVDQRMIDIAVKTGMPVKLSPKFWAEHMGVGYHQADIRELEVPTPSRMEKGTFALSNGSRRFLRYGYGDLFDHDRRYGILFRLWPGSQRVLMWGDPEIAAGYGRASHFCGASGLEICEPLFFKGREGSGAPGGRCAYRDTTLSPEKDFEKYLYFYRVWGRQLYNSDAEGSGWSRYLEAKFGSAAPSIETSLAQASRVLPIITTAHLCSASNHAFWPEVNTNMPIVLGSEPSPYSDTPTPKCFATVSPLDPQLFSSVDEYAADLLAGRRNAKYSPIEVAQWLEESVKKASESIAEAANHSSRNTAESRRIQEDVAIQVGIGQFFAGKLRSAVLFEIYRRTGDRAAGEQALAQYRQARAGWASMAERAKGVYRTDISYGRTPERRGHWADRLASIDIDLAAMEAALKQPQKSAEANHPGLKESVERALRQPERPVLECEHKAPEFFQPGEALPLSLAFVERGGRFKISYVRLYYRHVNHAERWKVTGMDFERNAWRAAIPGEYTNSVFPLQYYFEAGGATDAGLYPGLNAGLSNQPYFVVLRNDK